MDATDGQIRKALLALAIERGLLDMGEPIFEAVTGRLYKNYHCYIPDCDKHPEYLNAVLKALYGNSYLAIVDSIKKYLIEFSYQQPIAKFLKVISE